MKKAGEGFWALVENRWFNQMLDRSNKNDENLKVICYLIIFAFVQTKILLVAHDYAFKCPP
jgi:hypothetical protein